MCGNEGKVGNEQNTKGKKRVNYVQDLKDGIKLCLTMSSFRFEGWASANLMKFNRTKSCTCLGQSKAKIQAGRRMD